MLSLKLSSLFNYDAGKGHPAERLWEVRQKLSVSTGGMDKEGQIIPMTRGKS